VQVAGVGDPVVRGVGSDHRVGQADLVEQGLRCGDLDALADAVLSQHEPFGVADADSRCSPAPPVLAKVARNALPEIIRRLSIRTRLGWKRTFGVIKARDPQAELLSPYQWLLREDDSRGCVTILALRRRPARWAR
jgi:hypothetical protein